MVLTKVKDFLVMIDFEHTLFGLPFAYLGCFLAARGFPTWHQLLWITVAMISARTAALCLNRLIDRKIDRQNPRTSNWVLAEGRLPILPIWIIAVFLLLLLAYSAAQLNDLCFKLAPLAIAILWLYSYTKRFTWLCHYFLGGAIGIGPVGAWIAVTGAMDWRPFVLAAIVGFWIAGFDIMYACQDIQFDRENRLHSIPARFGETGALVFSAVSHLLVVVFLILNGVIHGLGMVYYLGILFVTILLVYEHYIVRPGDLSRVNQASFKINHYVGLIVFLTALADIFMGNQ